MVEVRDGSGAKWLRSGSQDGRRLAAGKLAGMMSSEADSAGHTGSGWVVRRA
jgi:hypothetical protein